MRNGRGPAPALEWRDTADIVVIPLDAFGTECVNQARYLDAALWREETRLRIIVPGVADGNQESPVLPSPSEDAEPARALLRQFFNASATPEGDVDHCILVGSLMEPGSADWSLLFYGELFSDPRFLHLWRACSLWACSETTTGLEYPKYAEGMEHARSVLHRIQSLHESSQGAPWQTETPQVIVGRAGGAASPLLPRDESALVVALGLLCRIYEIRGRLTQPGMVGAHMARPFFSVASEKAATPFVHFGASLVATHPSLLARAASADFVRRLFEILQQQADPEPGLEPRLDLHRQDLVPVIDLASNHALAETGRLALARGLATKEGGLSVDWLARELDRSELLEQWKNQIGENFGWERLKTLPLENWDQSLQEFDSLTSLFFEDQMAGFLKRFESEWTPLFAEGVARVLGEVAAREMLNEGGTMRPHLMARSVLHRIRERIEEGRRDDERARREEADRSPVDEVGLDLEKHPAMIQDRLVDLKRTLRTIPSPLAFYARLPIVFAIAFVAGEWINFARGTSLSPEIRFLVNTGIGFAAGLGLWMYLRARMCGIKKVLEEKYSEWLILVTEYHEHRFRIAARRSRALVWDLSALWCDWVADPAPEEQRHSLLEFAGRQAGTWPEHLRESLERMRPDSSIHAFLHDYRTSLKEGARHCELLVKAALQSLGGVRRKLLLPPFDDTTAGIDHFRSWLSREILVPPATETGPGWCAFLGDFMRRTPAHREDRAIFFHALPPRDGSSDDPPQWQVDLTAHIDLPEPAELSRSDDSVPPAFRALVDRFLASPAVSRPLEDLLDTWCYYQEDQRSVLDPDVKRRLELCDPSSPPGTRIQRCAVIPTEHRLVDAVSSDDDRTFTVGSLRFFGFLSVAREIPLAEACENFSITGSRARPTAPPAPAPSAAKAGAAKVGRKKQAKSEPAAPESNDA